MSAVIEIEESHVTSSGMRYRVWHEGAVLIESTRQAFFDAARELSKRGVTGRLQMKRRGRAQIDMSALIAVAATKAIAEGQSSSARIVKWVPHFMSKED